MLRYADDGPGGIWKDAMRQHLRTMLRVCLQGLSFQEAAARKTQAQGTMNTARAICSGTLDGNTGTVGTGAFACYSRFVPSAPKGCSGRGAWFGGVEGNLYLLRTRCGGKGEAKVGKGGDG